MLSRRVVTDEDRTEAKRLLLVWLSDPNADIDQLTTAAHDLHVQHNTFPGEEFMGLGADALEMANVGRIDPISYETLLAEHLPEIEFRGKQYRKIRFAVMASAGLQGGLDPDLLDEVAYWNDDYWRYALFASVALVRASATRGGLLIPELAAQLATLHGLELSSSSIEDHRAD